jgi:hypothetical protein
VKTYWNQEAMAKTKRRKVPEKEDAAAANNDRDDDAGRRRGAVVSVEGFAHRSSKSIKSFRQRRDKKRVQTARALKEYRTVMKREGYEAGTGASRKRPRNEDEQVGQRKERADHAAEEQLQKQQTTEVSENNTGRQKPRTHMFQKSVQAAEKRAKKMEEQRHTQETNERERKAKLRQRRQRTRQLKARTSKGQPVLQNMVHDILWKLQREQKETSSR